MSIIPHSSEGNTESTPLVITATPADRLDDPEHYHRRQVLVYALMSWLNCQLARLSRRPPPFPYRAVPFTCPLIYSLTITSLTLSTLAFFRYNSIETTWVHLYFGMLLFIQPWANERVNQRVLALLLPIENEYFRSRQFWQSLSAPRWYQTLTGLAGMLLAIWIAAPIFQSAFAERPGLPLYIPIILISFCLGSGISMMLIGATHFVQHLNPHYFHLYAFDPRKSPAIDRISEIFEAMLWLYGLILICLLLPLIFVPREGLLLVAGVAISAIGVSMLSGLFVFAQIRLSRLVSESKEQTLIALQHRIETFYRAAEKLDKTAFEDLQNLMKLHDQVASSSGWSLSTTRLSSYLRTIALPTIVAAYTNRDILRWAYEWISTQWL
jgi:hypothetical protein